MLRKAIRWGIIGAALVAPLMSGCLNTNLADGCQFALDCPPDGGADAGGDEG